MISKLWNDPERDFYKLGESFDIVNQRDARDRDKEDQRIK